ncbi:MAG: cytochrome c-type biogenesis CcmF C-terminal domain-containing protein [Acidobacteriota bacterium]|nr:cytochrome c-type biogenesis CcmF C-terminal domain-containing protein [Acidobacteriota bacterium]
MADLGNYLLILALTLTVFGTLAAFAAAAGARERFRKTAERAYIAAGVLVMGAVLVLGYLLQQDAFNIVYIYGHSNRALDTVFKLTAVWAGSEGSLLWWTLILMAFTVAFIAFTRKVPKLTHSWALFFIGLNIIFFLLINNIVSNPFAQWTQTIDGVVTPFVPNDGRGMNPQLQHWAMIIHPPLLYTGYIGFLFPFALMMGALITRLEGREWLPIVRRWTLVAWLILGVGIILGGAWAYMELGWGGYWAWDPVENASFMPWLLATAFLHSIMAQETRGMFKIWNVILLAGTYLMCLVGTGITRSGFISSVHAFAESDIGWYFLALILILTTLCVCVVALRRDQFVADNAIVHASSREVSLLFNNVIFLTIAVTMLLATVYPVIYEYMYGVKRELRHGFYDLVEVPLMLGMLLLMAIGPVLTWKRTSKRQIRERFIWPAVALVLTSGIVFFLNPEGRYSTLSFGIIAFLGVTIVQEFWTVISRRVKRSGENVFAALLSVVYMNKRRYGGYVTHFSVLIMAIGLTGAAFNQQAKEDLGVGESMSVAGYTFQVAEISGNNNDNYVAMTAKVNLMQDGEVVQTFHPEQRRYHASESQASEVSIWTTLLRDYYVVLAGPAEGSLNEHPIGIFHVYVNPLVSFVWAGGILMVFGTMISLLPLEALAWARGRQKTRTGAEVPA